MTTKSVVFKTLVTSKERSEAFVLPGDTLLYLNDIHDQLRARSPPTAAALASGHSLTRAPIFPFSVCPDSVQWMESSLSKQSESLGASQGNYLSQVNVELAAGTHDTNQTMQKVRLVLQCH